MTLRNGIEEREFLLMGTEGGVKPGPDPNEPLGQWCLWLAGTLEQTADGVPHLRRDFDGIVDHGCLYAVSSYEHPVSRKRILFGWIKEDELPAHRRAARGWAGYLSLPREMFLYSARGVLRGLRSSLADIRSLSATPDASGPASTIQTLGIRPIDDLRLLRPSRPTGRWSSLGSAGLSGILKRARSTSWELDAVVAVHPDDHGRVGFHICHDHDASRRTTVYFDAREERIVVDKSASNNDDEIAKHPESGPFTLFWLADAGGETLEKLRLRIFRDGDTLEVFANDRFALSTTVYADEACAGLSWFVEGAGDATGVFESVDFWDELGREPDVVNPHL
jgi:beta-fructofuranosidase